MAEVLLFHHAQGQTEGFMAFADELRQAGHTVHTPDLFDGRTFGTIDEGMAHVGRARLRRDHRPRRAGRERVWATSSSTPASRSASCRRRSSRRRAGARAGRCSSTPACRCPSSGRRGRPTCRCRSTGWTADPFFVDEGDIDAAREIVESTENGELYLYPGDQHYFADSSLPSYDAGATALLTRRVLDFLQTR